jgi:hypothetical protein
VTQYRDIIGVAIQKAIEGGNSAQRIAQGDKEFQEGLGKTEKERPIAPLRVCGPLTRRRLAVGQSC